MAKPWSDLRAQTGLVEWNRPTSIRQRGSQRQSATEIVQSIYGAIQEYTGVDRLEWLDLDYPSRPVFRPERC